MATSGLFEDRGNRADYVFGTTETGWAGVEVVRWRAREELGKPFDLEVTVRRSREAGPLALAALVDQAATLRIATESRWRPIHGIVVGAEELERGAEFFLYRLHVAPPSFRMSQRVRFRTFVDRTLREILMDLLENRSMAAPRGAGGLYAAEAPEPPSASPSFEAYEAAAPVYRFAVNVPDRLDDPDLRSYIVQYGESDLELFHRLLEEEGLTYFFEHGDSALCLTIVDRPGHASPFGREATAPLQPAANGMGVNERESITSLKLLHRLRWGSTTARDWDPARPQHPRQAFALDEVPDGSGDTKSPDPARYAHDIFPTRDGHVTDACQVPAMLEVERRAAERSRHVGRSSIRSLEPGLKVTVKDELGLHEDATIVIVSVTTFATQLEPEGTILDQEPWGLSGRGHQGAIYENELVALPEDVRFRPALATKPPRIDGVHTAVVSAEEITGEPPEIHIDEHARVRLRFPWDERVERGRPSSAWVRVSQGWAGSSYGQVFVPRVGQEVLVSYLAGDPERPLVVGRVYNAIQRVPYTKPTVSSIKTKSSPNSDGYNELRFDDEAGNEEVYLQAERNLNELVKASHSTSVGGDQSNAVGGNQSNSVTGNRNHHVGGDEDNHIGGHRSTQVDGNESYVIAGQLGTSVGANESRLVRGLRDTVVGGNDQLAVTGSRITTVVCNESRQVLCSDAVTVTGDRGVKVCGAHSMHSDTANSIDGPLFAADGAGATVALSAGNASMSSGAGATISCVGDTVIITASQIVLKSGGAALVMTGDIDAQASTIKLNG